MTRRAFFLALLSVAVVRKCDRKPAREILAPPFEALRGRVKLIVLMDEFPLNEQLALAS